MPDADHPAGMDRRKFLTVLGTTSGGALALSGCSTSRVEKLVPYLVQSEDQIPGIPTWYASTCTECAAGCGVHVRTREGRAVKLEGNPEHPVNQGKLCSRGQAALQGLYNPGRIKTPLARKPDGSFGSITWDDAIARLAGKLGPTAGKVAVLSGAGPGSFSDFLAEWTAALGGKVVRWTPFDHEPVRAANRQVFGVDELPAHDFANAKYILSFGADFLESWLSPTENQRGFAESHGFSDGDVAKFVYVGARRDLTGLNADEWLSAKPGTEAALALAVANVVAGGNPPAGLRSALAQFTPAFAAQETGVPAAVIERVAREFAAARPGLAVAGGIGAQHAGAAELCAAVNLLNYVAGNVGQTVRFGADLPAGDGYAGMARLEAAMDAGEVGVLLVHEANPVYALPRAAGFAARLAKVPYKVAVGLFLDETAAACDLVLPAHHALERWDDMTPRTGVRSLMQPVMEPVFDSRAPGDILLLVAKKAGGPLGKFTDASWEARLRSRWQALAAERNAADAGEFWRGALQRGGLFDAAPEPRQVSLAPSASEVKYTRPAFDGDGALVFLAYPHPMLHDGRGTNKPWLLENADPVTKITWHSWVELAPETARRMNVQDGEILRLTSPHGTIEAPAYVYPGLGPGVVAMPLGFGHTAYGAFAQGRGVNALDLLGAPKGEYVAYASTRVAAEKTGAWKKLATVEGVPRQLGRGIAEAMPVAAAKQRLSLEEYHLEGHEPGHEFNPPLEVQALKGWSESQQRMATKGDYTRDLPKWGMAIDLARCTGCQACVTACYAENNIPTIGEQEILKGREMTWMRIERYWEDAETPDQPPSARFVPMLCQHCANAPCEPVCPVYAAYHTADGLNGQVYNRCVGTRYCANNCPYKVRYFNWYKYNDLAWPEPLNLQLNPDVTVRARGVMEKCTFCIQRIRATQNQARVESRPIRDGEFTTACAQACPSDAIVFGNMMDPESRVAAIKQDPRGYHVLEELNTRPAITYLAKVLHPVEA